MTSRRIPREDGLGLLVLLPDEVEPRVLRLRHRLNHLLLAGLRYSYGQ